ncbi:MAG: 5-(carboxyamino)imidazole ribonucleotide mutase [bacterium]|nr:5-(carboxyamino)imidazole ribonucleotide mutase [bacterium]
MITPVAPTSPSVSIIMGSNSDWPTMQLAAKILNGLCVLYETKIVSAHRTPSRLDEYLEKVTERGVEIIIAGAGGAAHLAGVVAAKIRLPVIGVPMKTSSLGGLDSLYSTVQMPKGVPVATMAIGDAGAINAGLFAARILALRDPQLGQRLTEFIISQANGVPLEPFDLPV